MFLLLLTFIFNLQPIWKAILRLLKKRQSWWMTCWHGLKKTNSRKNTIVASAWQQTRRLWVLMTTRINGKTLSAFCMVCSSLTTNRTTSMFFYYYFCYDYAQAVVPACNRLLQLLLFKTSKFFSCLQERKCFVSLFFLVMMRKNINGTTHAALRTVWITPISNSTVHQGSVSSSSTKVLVFLSNYFFYY